MAATYLYTAIQYADMVASKQSTMTDRRALLTDREREIISGDADVSDSYRYQTISRIRARFDRLDGDLQALESHGALADELRDEICPTDTFDGHTQPPRDGPDPGETTPREQHAQSVGEDTTAGSGDVSARVSLRDQLREELAGSGDRLERRVDAVLAMYDHLREHTEATNDELQGLTDPDDVNYADAESMWSNMVKGKDTLRSLPGVVKPPKGTDDPWQYRECER